MMNSVSIEKIISIALNNEDLEHINTYSYCYRSVNVDIFPCREINISKDGGLNFYKCSNGLVGLTLQLDEFYAHGEDSRISIANIMNVMDILEAILDCKQIIPDGHGSSYGSDGETIQWMHGFYDVKNPHLILPIGTNLEEYSGSEPAMIITSEWNLGDDE